jgi:hypothetical protein
MLTQGQSFHPRRLQFVPVPLWVPQMLQRVNCLCDTYWQWGLALI